MRRLRGAIVLAITVAVAAALWTGGVRAVRRAERPAETAQQAAFVVEARQAAAGVVAWVAERRVQLAGARDALGPWSGATAQSASARPVLDRTLAAGGGFDGGLVVLDRQARVVATSASLAALGGQSRDLPAVRAALGGAGALSDVFEDPLLHVMHVAAVSPLRDGRGGITGALAGFTRVPDGSLARLVAALQSAQGSPVDVVTAGGTVVDGRPASEVIRTVGDDLRSAVRAAAGPAGFVEYEGEANVRVSAAYAPIGDGWVVVLPVRSGPLHAVGRRVTRTAAAVLGVALLMAVVAVMLLARLLRSRTGSVEVAKQSFLAIAGHELRTPLTVMKGFTELLVRRWDDVPDPTRHDIVETIGHQVRNLEHLVERLLLGAQLGAGVRPSISHEAVDLEPVLASTAAHHRAISPLHSFTVTADEGVQVWADGKALNHVLTNLVENAVKYSPNGGEVGLSARRRGGGVELVVEDAGIGLPSDLDAIFEKFVQREAVDTRTHDEGGVGLGLFIVRTLVEQMGGAVRAERRAPEGARLVVTLRVPRRSKT